MQKTLRHLEPGADPHEKLREFAAAEMAGTAETRRPRVSELVNSSAVSSSQAFSSERALLCGVLLGCWQPADVALGIADFQGVFHRRVFACITAMNAGGEPLSLPIIAERMKLDEVEMAQLEKLLDPLFLTGRREKDLQAHLRLVQRAARERDLRLACEEAVKANGDMAGLIVEVQAKATKYLDSLRRPEDVDPGAWRKFFDTWEEFETAPALSFAIEGFLQNDAITAIAGLSGSSKTWIALSIAKALLFGPGKLWGLFRVPARADRVIYLIPESSRTPIKHRLQVMNLYDEIHAGRLLMRTLSKGPTPLLSDPRLLHEVKNAYVITDTAIRFMGAIDESSATEAAEGLSNDFLGLLRADARGVVPLFHSPKSFLKDTVMTLEGMIRGSSEFGAILASAWGIKQIDAATNTVHLQNLKSRDFDPCGPFQIVGRPYLDKAGDFALLKKPDECGSLADEQPDLRTGGGAPQAQRDAKAANLALMREWLSGEPKLTSPEITHKFKVAGVTISDSAIRRYRKELKL